MSSEHREAVDRPVLRGYRIDGARGRERARAAESAGVDLPISAEEVRRIASKGYPLWEPIPVMQLRNRRITVAYWDLSDRLAALIAGKDGRRDANWCTYSAWSSKTIGTWIDEDAVPEPLQKMRAPRIVRRALLALTRYLVQRHNGSSYRCLAAGNRFVFLEIGLAVARFLECFGNVDRSRLDEPGWQRYWAELKQRLDELAQLDPSWMLTEFPEPNDLRLGLRQYFEALFTTDPDERAELVLAGNLLLGAYEQRRVDAYVSTALALFPARATRSLIQHRDGAVRRWFRRWPSAVYARIMTKGLVLNCADEQLQVARPIPPHPTSPELPERALFPRDLDEITTPLLQALLTRYDLTGGDPSRCGVRDWTSFDERMSYITNLFRSRQQHPSLFARPFPPDVEATLLDGQLPPDSNS